MEEKESENEWEGLNNEADNIAEDTPKEQLTEESLEESEELSDKLATELATLKDTHLRLMAEYDNYRKRTLKEKAELIKNAGEQILTGLLPVVDDFERALDNIKPTDEVIQSFSDGISLIYNKFSTFLMQHGVKVIQTKDEDFNPDQMEAIATVPVPEEQLKRKIVDCVQKGYTLNEKVIRHAKVVVGE
ncbi:MAG: nucleotide exchange factor GrpE [Dysgonamonadaceae bacterium]|jgi:molecular chaperone GrpE|nr:nucleotide exchange factor GrpE [Dysgonamonadaceae bacterium]